MKNQLIDKKDFSNICDWDKIQYPVFSYKHTTKKLKNQMKNVSLLIEHIMALQQKLNDLQETMQQDGCRVNLLINNIFHTKPKFDFKKHFLLIRNNKIEIHDNEELNNALVQNEIKLLRLNDQEDLYSLIKPNNKCFSTTPRLFQLCQDISKEYMQHHDDYELCQEDFEAATQLHDCILEEIKSEFLNNNIVNISSGIEAVEPFNDNIHDLIFIKDKNRLELFFTRKENKEDFLKRIEEKITI